jgi:glucokinase
MTTIPNEYAIGVDIGGTNTKCGIVNRRGEVLQYEKLSTPDYETPEEFVNALCVRLNLMIDKVGGIEQIKGIGVGELLHRHHRICAKPALGRCCSTGRYDL